MAGIKFGNIMTQLIFCMLYPQLIDVNISYSCQMRAANLLLSTPLFKHMILQIITGIQKPNAVKVLSAWRALLKTLKVALYKYLLL